MTAVFLRVMGGWKGFASSSAVSAFLAGVCAGLGICTLMYHRKQKQRQRSEQKQNAHIPSSSSSLSSSLAPLDTPGHPHKRACVCVSGSIAAVKVPVCVCDCVRVGEGVTIARMDVRTQTCNPLFPLSLLLPPGDRKSPS